LHLTTQNDQLMSERHVLGYKPALQVDFDLEGDRESYVKKALQGMQRNLAKWKGVVPAFGRPTGIVVNYTPDHAIGFDLDGMPREFSSKTCRVGQARLLINGRPMSAASGFGRAIMNLILLNCSQNLAKCRSLKRENPTFSLVPGFWAVT
jgi:hypothetical protein